MSAREYMTTIKESLKQYLEQLTQAQTLWVGFSGGLDSTVLLHALAQMPELKSKLKAIHVHHGLSKNADVWLEHCQGFCQQLGIPLVAEKVQLTNNKDGIEQAARVARYDAYKKHTQAGDYLLQAHHGDDQIETFMMRATRGSGLQGLASIPKQRQLSDNITILRPLLALPRAVLEKYAAQQQLSWVEDESNQDSSYERNWWRNELLPRIWQQFPQRQQVMLRSIEQLQQDAELLEQLLKPLLASCVVDWPWPNTANTALCLTSLQQQPVNTQSYLVRLWLQQHGLLLPSQKWLAEFLAVFLTSSEDAQPVLEISGWQLLRHQDKAYLYQAPSKQPKTMVCADGTTQIDWCGGNITIEYANQEPLAGQYHLAPASDCFNQKIKLQNRPHKTVKALFQEANVPVPLRAYWPVLIKNDELCSVVGLAVSENYQNTNFTMRWSAN